MSKETDKFTQDLHLELLTTFHRQFAENQREKEQSFFRFAAFVGATVTGYGYVFQQSPVNIPLLSLTLLAVSILLLFGASVIISIAYNWRRDQVINARIRRLAGAIGTGRVFPDTYDPTTTIKHKNVFTWMPNLLCTFYLLFLAVQTLALASYMLRLNIRPVGLQEINPYVTAAFWGGCLSIGASIIVAYTFQKKLVSFVALADTKDGDGVANSGSPEGSR